MATMSLSNKVKKFFNKYEKSDDYESMVNGCFGLYPTIIDKLSLSKDFTMYTDVITFRDNKRRFCHVFIVKKERKQGEKLPSYKRVREFDVEFNEDLTKYYKRFKNAAIFEIML